MRIVFVSLIFCFFTACSSSFENKDFTGTWKVDQAVVNMGYPDEEKRAMEKSYMGAIFEFNKDGSFIHVVGRTEAKGFWVIENSCLMLTTTNVGTEFSNEYSVTFQKNGNLKMVRIYPTGTIDFSLTKL